MFKKISNKKKYLLIVSVCIFAVSLLFLNKEAFGAGGNAQTGGVGGYCTPYPQPGFWVSCPRGWAKYNVANGNPISGPADNNTGGTNGPHPVCTHYPSTTPTNRGFYEVKCSNGDSVFLGDYGIGGLSNKQTFEGAQKACADINAKELRIAVIGGIGVTYLYGDNKGKDFSNYYLAYAAIKPAASGYNGWYCSGKTSWSTLGKTNVKTGGYVGSWSGISIDNTISVEPGTTVYFSGKIEAKRISPNFRHLPITYTIKKTGGWSGEIKSAKIDAEPAYSNPSTKDLGINALHSYKTTTNDVGKTLCVELTWSPTSTSNKGATSKTSCVKVENKKFTTQGVTRMNVNGVRVADNPSSTPQSTPTSDIIKNVSIGDKVGWQFNISNINNSAVSASSVKASATFSGAWSGTANKSVTSLAIGANYNFDGGAGKSFNSPLTITADMVGNTYCGHIDSWSPLNQNGGSGSTGKICAKVPYNYPGCEGIKCESEGGSGGDCALDGTCSNQCTVDDDCAHGSVISRGVKPVTTTSYSIAQPGDQVSFEYKLTNSGPTKTLDLTYRANVFIIPGAAASYNPDSATRAYGLWPSGWTRTGGVPVSLEREVLVGNGVINVETRDVGNSGILTLSAAGGYNISPGDMICSYLSVNKWSVVNDKVTGTIAASNVKCIQISKTPSLNIRGSDSMSGAKNWGSVVINKNGGFIGSSSSANNPLSVNQGSYSQYGLFANQSGTGSAPITNFGSAGWTANANFATIKNGNKTCALWAANTSGSGNSSNCLSNGQWQGGSFGNTSRTIRIPEISANSKISSQSTLDLNTLSGVDESIRFTTKNLDINGGKIKNRTTKVLYVEGNVNIVKDISMYHSFTNYSNIREIPSLIIYATGNITISSEVTIVDAVLIAGGHLNTCAQGTNGAPSLSGSGACSKQLIINGAVISKDAPRWYRTYGNENDGSFAPAEIINYTPNVFLLPFARTEDSNASGGWQTINSASMPTRY